MLVISICETPFDYLEINYQQQLHFSCLFSDATTSPRKSQRRRCSAAVGQTRAGLEAVRGACGLQKHACTLSAAAASLQTYNFIHELPGFLHGPPVSSGLLRWSHGILDSIDEAQNTTLASVWSTAARVSPVESCCHVLCAGRQEPRLQITVRFSKCYYIFWERCFTCRPSAKQNSLISG